MRYNKSEVKYFFSKEEQGDLFLLSNMAQLPLVWKGRKVSSSETLYQAAKYSGDTICLPASAKEGTNPYVRERILCAKNAMGSKMTQKCAVKAGLVRPDWPEVMIDAMRWVLELKLQQHSETFGRVLKSTGTKPIVEKSRKDQFWGAREMEDGTLIGENHLGILLTELRDYMDWVLAGNLTHPEGFLL